MSRHQRLAFKVPSRLWYNVVVRCAMRHSLVVPRSTAAAEFVSNYAARVSDTIVDHGANAQLLYPDDSPTDSFIVLSRLVPGKRIDTIINKFAALVAMPQYAHYRLHIVGDGDSAANIKQQAINAGLQEKVIFHGFMRHHEVAPLLRGARAMLVNTAMDLNMVSIPEAIVSGTPVITNTLPATAQFIVEHGLGIARNNWDTTDLVDIINHYDRYHAACVAVRDTLTNVGCAARMVNIFNNSQQQP